MTALDRARARVAATRYPLSTGLRKQTSDYGDDVLCLLDAGSTSLACDVEPEDGELIVFSTNLARVLTAEGTVSRLAELIFESIEVERDDSNGVEVNVIGDTMPIALAVLSLLAEMAEAGE